MPWTPGQDSDDMVPEADSDDASPGTGGASGNATGTDPEDPPMPDLPPPAPTLAEGIQITDVEVNQAVPVPLWTNGQYVDINARNARFVQNRPALVRAYWSIDAGWQPREVDGRLRVTLTDGTSEVLSDVRTVAGPADPSDLDGTFRWTIPEALTQVGATFQIELADPALAPGGPLPASPPIVPPGGPAPLGVEGDAQVLRVLLVPVHHTIFNNCPAPAAIADVELQAMIDHLHGKNPTREVQVEIREPFPYSGNLSGFDGILSALADQRYADGTDPEVYVYGLIEHCSGNSGGLAGQAISIPDWPTPDNAWTRVSVGIRYNDEHSTALLATHEIGHSLGRYHIYCSGGEAGYDPAYPYDGGDIGGWGYSIVSETLKEPSKKDYMTYCSDNWVSDFGWEVVYPTIEEVSSWGSGQYVPEGTLLIGAVGGDEPEYWFTAPGALTPPPHGGATIELQTPEGTLEVPAFVSKRPHSNTRNVVVELPVAAEDLLGATRVEPEGGRYPITIRP
ncbi:MAG: hypothetical protein K0V04_18805 [Deltaproteobacteria bacterium]|nr:hypothetical protein [Deltaproteobacteria bacterium]